MSADGLARFATSAAGGVYRTVCQRWGIDPAAPLAFDDVLAHDFRTALLMTEPTPEPGPTEPQTGVVTDLEAQMKALEARFT